MGVPSENEQSQPAYDTSTPSVRKSGRKITPKRLHEYDYSTAASGAPKSKRRAVESKTSSVVDADKTPNNGDSPTSSPTTVSVESKKSSVDNADKSPDNDIGDSSRLTPPSKPLAASEFRKGRKEVDPRIHAMETLPYKVFQAVQQVMEKDWTQEKIEDQLEFVIQERRGDLSDTERSCVFDSLVQLCKSLKVSNMRQERQNFLLKKALCPDEQAVLSGTTMDTWYCLWKQYKHKNEEIQQQFKYLMSLEIRRINSLPGREKPLCCFLCNKTFTTVPSVITHLMAKAELKEWTCRKCEISGSKKHTFTRPNTLKEHIWNKAEIVTRYLCPHCGHRGNQTSHFKAHYYQCHGESQGDHVESVMNMNRGLLFHYLVLAMEQLVSESERTNGF